MLGQLCFGRSFRRVAQRLEIRNDAGLACSLLGDFNVLYAITGGLGFIGLSLAGRLQSQGHEVRIIDNLSAQIHGALPAVSVPDGVSVLRHDVRDLASHAEALEGVDAVFHLAAETGTAQSMYRISHYVGVNDGGTAALLEAIARCTRRPGQVVLASSRAVYGEGAYRRDDGSVVQPPPRTRAQLAARRWEHVDSDGRELRSVPTEESVSFSPGSIYAATKAAQEMLVSAGSAALGLRSTILRFQNVYGEGQSLRNPYTGIISIFYNRARQGLPISIFEDGLESRDFVHVDDVVEALFRSVSCDLPASAIINVGSGVATAVHELAARLIRIAGFNVPLEVSAEFRVGDIRHCTADLARLESLLGLRPTVSLEDGLARFCRWAALQPVHKDDSERASAELRRAGLGAP
jgi:dTDP-L-rhamnose 4-epimerase